MYYIGIHIPYSTYHAIDCAPLARKKRTERGGKEVADKVGSGWHKWESCVLLAVPFCHSRKPLSNASFFLPRLLFPLRAALSSSHIFFVFFFWIFYVPSRPAVIFHAEISTPDHEACRRLVLLLFEIETKLRPRYALNPISDILHPSHLRLPLPFPPFTSWRDKIRPALVHRPNELLSKG